MNETVNANEFAKRYSEEFGVPIKEAIIACHRVWLLGSHLLYAEGKDVSISRFGVLRRQRMAPKRFKHPVSKKIITRDAKDVIKFKASKNPFELDKPPWE